MILTVSYTDGTEEAFHVAPQTKLKACRKDGYWFIPAEGCQVVIGEEIVERLELGNLTFADEENRIDADAGQA